MALQLYLDAGTTTLIDDTNPDIYSEAVSAGSNAVGETTLYLKSDDSSLTYENISITSESIAVNWADATSYVARDAGTNTEADVVIGSDSNIYKCIVDHTSAPTNEPITGANYETYWEQVKDVTLEFAEDSGGSPVTYNTTLSIADGDYTTATPIWRRSTTNSVQEAFRRADLRHKVVSDEYVK